TLRISTAREDTFVAGLSMGGFGAFKLALNHPERFAAAASLSGALDVTTLREEIGTGHLLPRGWAGRATARTVDDLRGLPAGTALAPLPALYLDCGTADERRGTNRGFLDAAAQHGVEVTSRLRPGAHTWDFWDQGIQDVLDWLPLRG